MTLPTSGNLALTAVMTGDATSGQVWVVEVAGDLAVEVMFTSEPPTGIPALVTSTLASTLRTATLVGALRTYTDIAGEVT